MASSQTGRATVFGFNDGTVAYTGYGALLKDSGDFSHEFKLDELMDGDNQIVSLVASHGVYKATLTFSPVATTGTNTLANAKLSLEPPAKLARVTLASMAWAGGNHARWAYVGGWKISFKKDGIAVYTLDIMCSEDSGVDLSAPVS